MGFRHWVLLALLALPVLAQAGPSSQIVYFPAALHKASVVCTWGSVRQTLAVWPPFFDNWFSEQLAAAREPSLWGASRTAAPGTSSYRFTWLRSFHAPVIVRIDQDADGKAILTAKMLSGRGGYDPGHVNKVVQRPLSSPEIQQVKALFAGRRSTDLRTNPCNIATDGAQWVVEMRTGRRYRAVHDFSPRQGPIFNIGTSLVRLSGLDVGPIY